MEITNVSQQANGNWQVGNDILTPDQFKSHIEKLANNNDSGLFKIGSTYEVTASQLSSDVKSGKFSFISGANLTPPNNSGDKGFDTDKLSNLSSIMAEVFKLITETSITNRQSAREARNAAQAAEQADLSSQVELQKEAADKAFQAAIISAAVSIGVAIGSSAISIGSSLKGLKELKGMMNSIKGMGADVATEGAASGIKMGSHRAAKNASTTPNTWQSAKPSQLNQATEAPGMTSDQFSATMAKFNAKQQIFQSINDGAAKTATGASDIAKGVVDHQAETIRAQATQAEASSRLDSAAAQEETEFLNSYQDILRDFMQKMSAINDSTEQTLSQIVRA